MDVVIPGSPRRAFICNWISFLKRLTGFDEYVKQILYKRIILVGLGSSYQTTLDCKWILFSVLFLVSLFDLMARDKLEKDFKWLLLLVGHWYRRENRRAGKQQLFIRLLYGFKSMAFM